MKKITRIELPTYKVIEDLTILILNELEVRQLQVDVKMGVRPHGLIVTDIKDNVCTIGPDGRFDKVPYGFGLAYEFSKQLLD